MRYADDYGSFMLEALPSQPQLAWCHGLFVQPHLRGLGLGHKIKATQMQQLSALHYDFALCTVRRNNAAQQAVCQSAGWAVLATFLDRRNGEVVDLWGSPVPHTQSGLAQAQAQAEKSVPACGHSEPRFLQLAESV